MKKILLVILIVGGLVAGLTLVNRSQETRRGATYAEVNPLFLPLSKNLIIGETFSVSFKIDTVDKKVHGIQAQILFDKAKLEIDEAIPATVGASFSRPLFDGLGGVVGEENWVNQGNTTGIISVDGIRLESDENNLPSGVVDIARFWFIAKENGVAEIKMDSSYENFVVGYNAGVADRRNIGTSNKGVYTIGGGVTPGVTEGVDNSCTDSDGGKTYGTKGETCIGTNCSNDNCTAAGRLQEFYCDTDGKKVSEIVECGTGKSCFEGKCVTNSVAPENTPVPTMQPNGTDSYLNIRFKYSGMVNEPKCGGDLKTSLIVLGGGESAVYRDVLPEKKTLEEGVVYEIHKVLTGFRASEKVAVFLKGPKHLQVKYGINNQDEMYNRPGGELTLTTDVDSPFYDFTGYPILAGDVNQDGMVDGRDFVALRDDNVATKKVTEGEVLATDLDGDCVVTGHDMQLLRFSLNERQSQIY